jgi:hypothetical protein
MLVRHTFFLPKKLCSSEQPTTEPLGLKRVAECPAPVHHLTNASIQGPICTAATHRCTKWVQPGNKCSLVCIVLRCLCRQTGRLTCSALSSFREADSLSIPSNRPAATRLTSCTHSTPVGLRLAACGGGAHRYHLVTGYWRGCVHCSVLNVPPVI